MNLENLSHDQLKLLAYAQMRLPMATERDRLEASLIEFVRAAWPSIDPSEFQESWAIGALCEHLQAVTDGQIDRLLVNFPPRCAKTLVASVCWPVWTWAQRETSYRAGPQVRFLCGSYNHTLSLENSNKTRRLIESQWLQKRWGSRIKVRKDQNTKAQFDTTAGGSRLATSVGGSLLGIGGDIILIDDPHNTEAVESEAERETVGNWWREVSSTRLNDPKQSAVVVIMQRLHEDDVSGQILASGDDNWVHLMLPMRYDIDRHCVTVPIGTSEIAWEDPRTQDGDLLWPERFGDVEVSRLERDLGPYFASGRLQQSPQPKGGGIFQSEWWQLWDSPDGKFPELQYIVASLDGAFTEDEENDPSGMTVWGVFQNEERKHRVILLTAWRKHLEFSGAREDKKSTESIAAYRQRTLPNWGLIEWVADTCERFKVDKLLIEAKASGISAAQELQNRYGRRNWAVHLCPVKGDKVARALAVQPTFSQQIVYAPDREWADMVITEMGNFPKGKYDDLTDSTTQAMKYLRDCGMLTTDEELHAADVDRVTHRPKPKPLYPV